MSFPNAAKGVKRIFTAEILGLISAVITIIAVVLMIITLAAAKANSESGTIVAGVGTGFFTIAAAVLSLISGIMALVGIINASKDEGAFKTALIMIVVSLCAAIVAAIFSRNATVQSICQIIQNLMGIFVTVFVIKGVTNLADRLNDDDVSRQGRNLLTIIIVVYALALIANIIVLIFGGMFASVTAGVIAVVALVLQIVGYFVYLSLLSKGKNMLAE